MAVDADTLEHPHTAGGTYIILPQYVNLIIRRLQNAKSSIMQLRTLSNATAYYL